MSVYKRGAVYWYKFYFANKLIRESVKTSSKTLAKEAERRRRRELEEGYSGITKEDRGERVQSLREAAKHYGSDYEARHPESYPRFVKYCIAHLVSLLGDKMLIEITPKIVEEYQSARIKEGASGKTINEEVGVLLRIMGRWGNIVGLQLKEENALKLPQRENCGKALTADEEAKLLAGARKSKSPALYPAVVLALNTGMRDSEMRHLTWGRIDFFKQILTVGRSKTRAGTGRTIPLNSEAIRVLGDYKAWYEREIGLTKPEYYVFPWGKSKKYDPTRPMVTFKTAWINAREDAGVAARLHDLRHTLITKLAESGAGDETIMAIAGHVSRSMLSRYAHIRTEAKRRALEAVATKPAISVALQESCDTVTKIH